MLLCKGENLNATPPPFSNILNCSVEELQNLVHSSLSYLVIFFRIIIEYLLWSIIKLDIAQDAKMINTKFLSSWSFLTTRENTTSTSKEGLIHQYSWVYFIHSTLLMVEYIQEKCKLKALFHGIYSLAKETRVKTNERFRGEIKSLREQNGNLLSCWTGGNHSD